MFRLDPIHSPDRWPHPTTDYEAEALRFCQTWRSGQTEFVLHTSGSTGTPKAIGLSRAQMIASAQLTGQALNLQPGDSALVCLNVRYVAGVMMLVRGLELGLPMTIVEPTTHLLDILPPQSQFDFTALVPLQLQTVVVDNERGLTLLNRMKAILVGGAATSPSLEQAVQAVTAPVWATYGMTETVSHIALRRLNGPSASDWFTALPGVSLRLDDRGCLSIQSAATNFDRIETNDLADLHPDGSFRLLGRADSIINSGGVKINPEAVERVIQTVLANRNLSVRLFITGLPDDRLGQRVTIISEVGTMNNEQVPISNQFPDYELFREIQGEIRKAVGPYAIPREWITMQTFVETPTGKIDRKATVRQLNGQTVRLFKRRLDR